MAASSSALFTNGEMPWRANYIAGRDPGSHRGRSGTHPHIWHLPQVLADLRSALDSHIDDPGPEVDMANPKKIDELAAAIDDASTTVEELQVDHEADAQEKLDDLHKTLEHASDVLDEIGDKDERK